MTRVVTCQACGWVVLRRAADVMECAQLAVQHVDEAGCPGDILIHPLHCA